MMRPPDSESNSNELLERGRLTLQAIEYQERAARFHSAAASLKAALIQAENGDIANLQDWLDRQSPTLDEEISLLHRTEPGGDCSPSMRLLRVDQPVAPHHGTPEKIDDHAVVNDLRASDIDKDVDAPDSPWYRMDKAAKERLTAASNLASALPLPTELQTAISNLDFESESKRDKNWWRAPHVWVSLVLHVFLIVGLAFFMISAASEPKVLSIVSAAVAAENVLLETPMEMVSELESIPEALQSTPKPNLAELADDLNLVEAPIEAGTLPALPASPASEVTSAASHLSQSSMTGSKTLTGAEFFGVKATGNIFVYIVDSSPSMRRDGAFEAARNEIVRSLTSMKPKQRYYVSFFGKEIDPMVLEMGVDEKYPVYAKPENLTKTIDWLRAVQVQKEGLPPNNALAEAIGMQPDGIFLLFDGDTKVDVAKFLRRVNRSDDVLNFGTPKVPIHVIHFFQEDFQMQMKQVAEENGGTYRFVPRPAKGKR